MSSRSRSRSPYPRDRFTGSRRFEPDRLSNLKSNHEETLTDSEVSMKKLSEFNESLRRQQQSTSTKFQWKHMLSDNRKKAAEAEAALTAVVTKPEPTTSNFITAPSTTYSMSPTGILGSIQENHRFIGSTPLHLKEVKPGFIDNGGEGGEGFRYPEIINEGMTGHAVGFGEKIGSPALSQMAMDRIRRTEEETSSSAILQMAMERIRKTEEATALAHWKIERARARAGPIDSIVDKIDGVGESAALEMKRRSSFPQTQHLSDQMREALHGVMLQQREDCSRPGFNGGERVVGPNGALFHGEIRPLPPFYPDAIATDSQSQNGGIFIGERKQFDERLVHFSKESRNEDFGSMSCHQSPKRVPFHGGKQEFSEDYGHSLPQHCIGLGRESHVTEQKNDVFGSRMNLPPQSQEVPLLKSSERHEISGSYAHSLPQTSIGFSRESHVMEQKNVVFGSSMNLPPQSQEVPLLKSGERREISGSYGHSLPQNVIGFGLESQVTEHRNDVFGSRTKLSEGERQELSADYGRSLVQQHHLDLNVEPDETQQDNQLLGSRMNHHPRQNETPSHGEKRKMQENFSQSLPHHLGGLNGGSKVMEQKTEALGSRDEAHFHGESQHLQHKQECALKINPLPKDECNGVYTNEGSTQHISTIEDVGMNSQSVTEHPKRRIIDLRKIRESRVSKLTQTSDDSNDKIPGREYGGQQWSNAADRKSIKQRLGQPFPANNPNPLPRKSIKHRLGSPSQVDQSRKSVKQRLGPPYGVHNPIDMPRIERHKLGKPTKENDKEFDKRVQARDVSHLVKRGRDEPHEDSDEFKQLIHDTYVKFVKVLNENPAQRRKYEGEAETLKCCVCGSESKDYVTQSLVTHAFTSRKRRVEHLGLHKALCLLMGWESKTVSKGLWAPKSLPVAEALAMKEDLVIWPPVVILHNSSIGTNSDDRIIVSIKDHEAFLKDAGFGEGISKVCRGKPANQSIMVVIFKETISGLREAERLHSFYAKNKHGRAEFQQVNSTGGGRQRGPLHKVKHVLYGYLGIAGDLDKLDFETKSHSIIKSKKKVYALADARRDRDSKKRYRVNDGS